MGDNGIVRAMLVVVDLLEQQTLKILWRNHVVCVGVTKDGTRVGEDGVAVCWAAVCMCVVVSIEELEGCSDVIASCTFAFADSRQ